MLYMQVATILWLTHGDLLEMQKNLVKEELLSLRKKLLDKIFLHFDNFSHELITQEPKFLRHIYADLLRR